MNIEALAKMAQQQFGTGSSSTITAILQYLLRQFTNDAEGGFNGFLNMFRNAGMGNLVNGWLGGQSTAALSDDQVRSALGGGMLGRIQSLPGVSASSVVPLLGFLIPKVVGALTPAGQMPTRAGLMQQLSSLPSMPTVAEPVHAMVAENATRRSSWLVPFLAGLALVALLLYLTRGRDTAETVAASVANSASNAANEAAGTVKSVFQDLGTFLKRKLPSGVELDIPEYGIENRLVNFIEDNSRTIDTTTWFDFDRLLFDTGKATLQPASQEQLKNIAAILAAYPRVKIKIGGYTDNIGTAEGNLQLSSERANNVMAELGKLGVASDRMEAEGYGMEHPVADNSTPEGRAKNRRISLRVTAK